MASTSIDGEGCHRSWGLASVLLSYSFLSITCKIILIFRCPGHAADPFSVGVVSNCRDFWTRGHELGVEYDRLYYEVPAEGLWEASEETPLQL